MAEGRGHPLPRRSVLAGLGGATVIAALPDPGRAATGQRVADAAADWLSGLSGKQRERAAVVFTDAERFNWHYTPRRRRGLPLKDMSASQRRAAFAVLREGLGAAGYRKAQQIMDLEEVLRQIETFGFSRDRENYYLTVFGTPGTEATWGWRFEGHHVSINMTFRDGALVAATPLFLGANPAIVQAGEHAGLQVLGDEIGAARALLEQLSGPQIATAVIADRAFGDIVSGPGREDSLKSPQGLAATSMTAAQRDALARLVEVYASALPDDEAAAERRRVREAGLDTLHFAWAGATEPGRGGHYFRVHAPVLLIEYDNSRNDANHVHSVWLDPSNPFGRDVLGEHYRHSQAHSQA